MDRRSFIRNTSLAALAALAPSLCLHSCRKDTAMPIIDTHQHLWDLDLFPLGWVRPPIDKSFLMEDYLQAVEGQNVVKAIYMEVNVPPVLKKKEAEWALSLCKDPGNPTVAAVISGDVTDEGFESYIRSFEGDPHLKGVRYFFKNLEEILQPQVLENIRLLGKMGLTFDLSLPPAWLHIGNKLLDACPNTSFVLNHCGGADPVAFLPEGKEAPRGPEHDKEIWKEGMALMAERENIICKISGIVAHVPDFPLTADDLAPIINHCISVYGPDRVIFAGDWPVCLLNMPLTQGISTLKEVVADRSTGEQRKLFHDNALVFFELE